MSKGPFTLLESALPIELNSASATVLAQIKVQFFYDFESQWLSDDLHDVWKVCLCTDKSNPAFKLIIQNKRNSTFVTVKL